MAAGMRTEGDKDDKKARGDRSDAMAGFIFILGFLDVLLAGMMVPLMPGIVRSFGGGVATLGLLHTLQGASKLSSAFVFGWVIDKFGFRAAMLVSLAGCALAYLPIAFASSLGYVTLGKLLLGCFRQTTFVCEAIVARTKEVTARVRHACIRGEQNVIPLHV
ncbi:hypothetical protein PTSG_05560 [Salpingoeca rosetta]|uniref:Major facilitator superfamily (MFS) profile domain-containing protein n=1 Tax=Salpingoeca rosetta (strain ATCC 50818 / BSB-021) TaxID=946362 RepID=F2UBJ9_SALR5|nr:uncharacterized protein PTSG_05560 [Salpingoeca rosetta]EGD73865.1 hypothetical protein PTSG_05560 [Salpingoeca rosetta]|eukprot:XP_004993428.1 hypothetical protein PTSG_05560 [Salpingoeca rosetta]